MKKGGKDRGQGYTEGHHRSRFFNLFHVILDQTECIALRIYSKPIHMHCIQFTGHLHRVSNYELYIEHVNLKATIAVAIVHTQVLHRVSNYELYIEHVNLKAIIAVAMVHTQVMSKQGNNNAIIDVANAHAQALNNANVEY